MKKEPHITEFTAKKGNGLHIRVTTTRKGRRIAVDGGRLYYKDFGTKADTLRAARKIRDSILEDLDLRPVSLPKLSEIYEHSFDLIPCAISTREAFDAMYKHIGFDKPISHVTLSDIQTSVNEYSKTHTQTRITKFITLWNRIYKTAFLMQLPVTDYPKMVVIPKSKVVPKKYNKELTYEELIAFISALQLSKSYYAPLVTSMCWIMYYTGMRLQEVIGLMVDDIDLDRNIIHVRRSIGSDRTKSAVIVPPKTLLSIRDIPVAPALKPVLERTLATTDTDLLFTEENGHPIYAPNISKYVKAVGKRNGLRFNMYALRHLFSADLFRQGVNPKVIQSLMGHANADMSAYYAFTTDQERIDAITNRK